MSAILVQEVFQGPALAAGVTVASVAVAVTDASGAVQNQTLNGSESPPWSAAFTVASGAGSVSSTRTDSTGATGTPVVTNYDTVAPVAALDLSSTTVTVTAP